MPESAAYCMVKLLWEEADNSNGPVRVSPQPHGDPVARFHLDNGARLERLNASANLSVKGLKQSAGMMVNYLYDLAKVELVHDRFAHGKVAHSRAVSALV